MIHIVPLRLVPALVIGGLLAAGLTTPIASAASYSEIHRFTGGADGAQPLSGTVRDSAGNLYGENNSGALACQKLIPNGCGTVYKVDPQGNTTALVTFQGQNGRYGSNPLTLVGNRLFGSVASGDASAPYGLVFAVNTDGSNFTILHLFAPETGDRVTGQLQVTPNGMIYGTTQGGGNICDVCEAGVLFRITPDGTYTVLHNFSSQSTDSEPGQILVAPNGTIFGATGYGHDNGSGGTLYQFTPATGVYKTLHVFYTQKDGEYPTLGGISPDNVLYGATLLGGSPADAGTLFQIGRGGFKTLYTFQGGTAGSRPNQPTINAAGALQGTMAGGANNAGAVYSFSNGALTVLYSLPAGGLNTPLGNITFGPSGSIIGAAMNTSNMTCTFANGKIIPDVQGCGGIFSVTP